MLPTYERAHTHVRTRPRKAADSSKQAGHSRQSILGGVVPADPVQRGTCETMRNVLGCASFLTVLRAHRISRSLFLIPQRIPASPAVVPAAAGPAPHARPAASKHHTRMQHAAPCIACGSREYSGRVLLSDVPSPPHEVPTPADGHLHLPDAIRQRQAVERPRRGRARRSRADGTISGLAVGHCD
jgi:hypothetical protein